MPVSDPRPGLKRCSDCKKLLASNLFPKDRSRGDGLGYKCRPCQRRRSNSNYASFPEKWRDRWLERNYGITRSHVDEMMQAQGGTCAICDQPFGDGKTACVDHCHADGTVRGVLHVNCNSGLGMLKDTPENFACALVYLAAHGRALTTDQLQDFLAVYEPLTTTPLPSSEDTA